MSPDILYWLVLSAKIGLTVLVVIGVTIAAERGSALTGAFLATIPVVPAPVYVLLALDHDASFIAGSALFAVAGNAAAGLFVACYVLLAQRQSVWVSVGGALVVWGCGAWGISRIPYTPLTAAGATLAVLYGCFLVSRPYREAVMARLPVRLSDVLFRGAVAAVVSGTIFTMSNRLGPSWTGLLTVFPAGVGSIAFLLHVRLGGRASASVLANMPIGMMGFVVGTTLMAMTAERIGSYPAMTLAMAVSLCWNIVVFGLRSRRQRQAREKS